MMANIYEQGLDRNSANFTPITPLLFLERSAQTYPNKTAIIHGKLRQTWRQTDERCRRLASALQKHGIGLGDTVAVMLPNTPVEVRVLDLVTNLDRLDSDVTAGHQSLTVGLVLLVGLLVVSHGVSFE